MESNVKETEFVRKEAPTGILRTESGKSRRASVDFKLLAQREPTSPQPSIDRFSVTFAEDSVKSDSSTKCNLYMNKMDKVHFPEHPEPTNDSDEEDYSASVHAIIQRKASTRKSRRRSSRRASSLFSPDILLGNENGRRRSSVLTTSSGDTVITMDENIGGGVSQDEIFENIKLHKEVLSSVKMQPWNMRKKLKLVVQAKTYIKKHEGALQERLAQSRSTRDMLARWNIYLIKKWQRFRRELANLSNWFIPWELKIKEIESHFGSVVASYFTFLRWLFWVNVVLAAVLISFVAVPEILTAKSNSFKRILPEEKYNSTNFQTLWDFEGIFRYSPLFYGWYTHEESKNSFYRTPIAYFITGLVAYAFSFWATLRKMAENSRMSKLSEKDDECIFSWKLFTAWDYMIGNAETAHNRIASIVVGFKEALLEEAEKKRESRNWKVTSFRLLVNSVVLGLLVFSVCAVAWVVDRSTKPEARSSVWRSNEITFVMTFISTSFPMLFEGLGYLEKYHPRKQLRLQLARIMVLNLLNLYSLIFALFYKINDMTTELGDFKKNYSNSTLLTYCHEICIREDNIPKAGNLMLSMAIASSASITAYPIMQSLSTQNDKKIPGISFTTVSPTDYESEAPEGSTLMDFSAASFIEAAENSTALVTVSGNATDTDKFDEGQDSLIDYLMQVLTDELLNNFTEQAISDADESSTSNEEISSTIFASTLYETSTTTSTTEIIQTEETFTPIPIITSANNTDTKPTLPNSTTAQITSARSISTFTTADTTSKSILNSTGTETDNVSFMTFTKPIFPKEKCSNICTTEITKTEDYEYEAHMNYSTRRRFRSLCWENMFGQELVKLTVMDLVMTIVSTMAMDFFRGIFVRVMNRCWCWDLEKKFPQYADFKVAENILHLVNNQGMVWMGLFFSPGLVPLNVVKLLILMYFRAWVVLTCNIPHEVIFRASRSNNFYYALLLMMLFLCVLPVGYAIVWVNPSWNCGPFTKYEKIFKIFTETVKENVPPAVAQALDYIASPGIVIPLLLLLVLIIYYLVSLTNALREANNDLKFQLRRERTEERRKMFQIADRRRRGGSGGSGEFANTSFVKWKKLINTMPNSGKSFDDTSPRQESIELPPAIKEEKHENVKSKDFFTKFMKKALRKSSTSEDENNVENQNADEGTDTEQHESLPEDLVSIKDYRSNQPSRLSSFDFPKAVAAIQRRNSQKINIDDSKISKKREMRQDSESSVWSDNIPVIMISKSESAECLDIVPEVLPKETKFKPKIKCALTKQSTEIDEDVICYFSKNLDLNSDKEQGKDVGISESSESARESSADTIVNTAIIEETEKEHDETIKENVVTVGQVSSNDSTTESSAEYNDIGSL